MTGGTPPRARWRAELRDFVEVMLIPSLAAVLPWPVAYRILRRVARADRLYREPNHQALDQAVRLGWAGDRDHWLLRRKLTTLVDHADHYLSRTRGDAWMRRHVEVIGQWPAPGEAALLLTFHWGAGMWGLRHAGSQDLAIHALVNVLDPVAFQGRTVLHAYVKARIQSVALALKRPFIDVTGGIREVLRALQRHEQVLAVIDVPPDQVTASAPVHVLGLPARLPTALLRVAVEKGIPIYLYDTGFRLEDGQRFLRIRALPQADDVESLAQTIAQALDALIREDAPSWHFWGEAERFFRH